MAKTIDLKFVSPEGFDLCVGCLVPTPYKTGTPVDARLCYVEGAGQLCAPEFNKLYGNSGESK